MCWNGVKSEVYLEKKWWKILFCVKIKVTFQFSLWFLCSSLKAISVKCFNVFYLKFFTVLLLEFLPKCKCWYLFIDKFLLVTKIAFNAVILKWCFLLKCKKWCLNDSQELTTKKFKMVLKFKSSNITSGKKVFVTSCCDLKSCD